MIQKVLIFSIIFISAVVQTSFFPNLTASSVVPNIILVAVVFWAARMGFSEAWRKTILGGLLLDIFYFLPIGTSILALSFSAGLASFLAKRFLVAQTAFRFLVLSSIISLATIANQIMLIFLLEIRSGGDFDSLVLLGRKEFFLSIVVNLAAFAALYWPLLRLEKILSVYDNKIRTAR